MAPTRPTPEPTRQSSRVRRVPARVEEARQDERMYQQTGRVVASSSKAPVRVEKAHQDKTHGGPSRPSVRLHLRQKTKARASSICDEIAFFGLMNLTPGTNAPTHCWKHNKTAKKPAQVAPEGRRPPVILRIPSAAELARRDLNHFARQTQLRRIERIDSNERIDNWITSVNNNVPLDDHPMVLLEADMRTMSVSTQSDQSAEHKRNSYMWRFAKEYNVRLSYPDLPLVKATKGKNTVLPMEILKIKQNQRYNYKMDERQTANMIKFAVTPPADRYKAIEHGVGMLTPFGA